MQSLSLKSGVNFLTLLVFAVFYLIVTPLQAVSIKEVRSPGGIEAWLVQDKSVPVISLNFAFKTGGTAYDPQGKEGLARMVAAMLDEGAGPLNSQEFQKQIQGTAARLRFSASTDKFRGSFRTLKDRKDEAFRLLGLALTKPRFDQRAITRIRGQIIASIQRKAKDPDSIAIAAWYREAFPDHPYGNLGDGTVNSIKALNKNDLKEFMLRHVVRNSLFIAVAGDISSVELGQKLDQVFSKLPLNGSREKIMKISPMATGRTLVIERAIPQSIVIFGHSGIKRDHPDWYIASVMNRILGGGGFSSRLMKEIRVKRGLAYGVYTYLNPYDHAATYMGRVATANARVAESLKVIRREWKKFAVKGVTAEELEAAKTYINGSFPLRLDSTHRIASLLLAVQVNNLGKDYLTTRASLINAVTPSDIKRVARKILKPAALRVVIVGQPDGIKTDH